MPNGPFQKKNRVRYEEARNPDVEEGGIIHISGSFLLDHEEDLLSLIKSEDRLARERNHDHHVNKIEKTKDGIMITVSNHNLAMRIGKALKSAYKGTFNFKYRPGEKFVEVDWNRD